MSSGGWGVTTPARVLDRWAGKAGNRSMPRPLQLSPDRLFPSDPAQRDIARRLYKEVAGLPIVSPHGHTDPAWFAGNAPFGNAAELLLHPDHYIFRMLYSQGIPLDADRKSTRLNSSH